MKTKLQHFGREDLADSVEEAVSGKLIKVVGIADAYGIESFTKKEHTKGSDRHFMQIRACANRHRHALYYEAEVTEYVYDKIKEQCRNENYEGALLILKEATHKIGFMDECQANSWQLIPDKKLDPWRA